MNIPKLKSNKKTLNGWLFEIIIEGKAINISREIAPYIDKRKVLKIKSDFFLTDLLKQNQLNRKYFIGEFPIKILENGDQ